MCRHEDKQCPRCGSTFECKVGNIAQCQCAGITLNEQEQQNIFEQFSGCLCLECLNELRFVYNTARFEQKLKKHPGH
jgi:hypothetical protein